MQISLNFLHNQSLSNYSTIRIGGNASKLLIISSEEELLLLARQASELDLRKVAIIGAGSNVLFSDGGYSGLVVVIRNDSITLVENSSEVILDVGAGTSLIRLAKYCYECGYAGMEWAAAIPASVGGAIFMNAGAFGHAISDVLISCKVMRGGKIEEINAVDLAFSYRKSIFNQKHSLLQMNEKAEERIPNEQLQLKSVLDNDVIVSGKLALKRGEKREIYKKMQDNLVVRKSKQPLGLSLGSVFKNGDRAAGYYIESAGMKGRAIGDLEVSEKHANFIINKGKGTARDFLALVEIIREEVQKKFGILLEEEFVRIGDF